MAEYKNIVNLRDMGGLKTPYGEIKSGMLYRSPVLYQKDERVNAIFHDLPIDIVVDLRTDREVKEKSDIVPASAVYVHSSVFGSEANEFLAPTKSSRFKMFFFGASRLQKCSEGILNAYARMPFSASYAPIFSAMDRGERILFHCAAGKDRTGIAAMLIELSLGRSFDECYEEYMMTNYYYTDFHKQVEDIFRKYFSFKKAFHRFICSAMYAREEYFAAARDAILSKYDSVSDFLSEVHGITPERISLWRSYYIDGV